jgi:hypothetical protein
MPALVFSRENLSIADLVVDAIYAGGRAGNTGDDPLGPLLGVSNQGGFRHLGRKERPHLLVITTSMAEPDWPDALDVETGIFTYYGDNRKPGRSLHDTPRWGNNMLSDLFARAHSGTDRQSVPPVLVFRTLGAGTYRDAKFLGLAVPGAAGVPATQDLVALWSHSGGDRFQNYKAMFTVLNAPQLSRKWLDDIQSGKPISDSAPSAWLDWLRGGEARALRSVATAETRSRLEQLPRTDPDRKTLRAVYDAFRARPHDFEICAARLAEMLLPGIVTIDVTRPSRDGGRDAIGKYRIGFDQSAVEVDFALEAKCYAVENSVGVKETSRLISRLRHRQFGILVTTSYVNEQAYKEIKDDKHPILILVAIDIVAILRRAGIRDSEAASTWVTNNFPPRA